LQRRQSVKRSVLNLTLIERVSNRRFFIYTSAFQKERSIEMNGYARCTVPPILVNARPKNNNNNNNNNNVIGNSSTSPTAAPTPKRTSEDRDDAKFGGVVSQQPHASVHHERGQRRKKSVRFTETPDEVVGTAEDIDRSSISAPKRCDVCNVHLVGFVWECGACCEQEKSTKNDGSGEDAMSSRGEQHQVQHSPSCQACEELVGVGRMAVREEERVKNTMLEIGPQSPHQSQGTVFNSGNTASSGGDHGFSPRSRNNKNNNNIEEGEGASKKGFRLCVSCYQMHARLSMSRTRFLEERKRKEEENLRKQTISSSSDDTITIKPTTTTTTLPVPVLNNTTASVSTAEATPEEKETVFSAGQNNSLWLQLAEQLQIHEHDPQNFIRTGLDDQLALEEIIRDRATLMVNGEDRLGRILKEATRRMDAAKQNDAESPENENSNGMHQNEEELAPAF
jgi:hypothetical protein